MTSAYSVEFVKSAKKEFDRLPLKAKGKILDALSLLAINPFSEMIPCKKIKGAENLYRVRVGDYRIVYDILKKKLRILVIKVGHRKDIYRNF